MSEKKNDSSSEEKTSSEVSSCNICADTERRITRPSYYGAKRAITGKIVAEVKANGGGLRLSKNWSRSLKIGEIHEIMLTQSTLSPGDVMKDFTAVAFFEVSQSGHSVIGDKLYLDGVEVGVLAGYEMNHMPNHMNIVFMSNGGSQSFKLNSDIRIQ